VWSVKKKSSSELWSGSNHLAWRCGVNTKDPVLIDAGPMPSSAWAGWMCFESEVEVEAAKGVPYRLPMFRAVQLSSEVYSSCGEEGLRCNVLYRRRSLNIQYSERVKPLEILTSLWLIHPFLMAIFLCSDFSLEFTLLYC
jgi:hypothetical protein